MKKKLYKIWFYNGNDVIEIFRLQASDVEQVVSYVEKHIIDMSVFDEDELDFDWSNEMPVWRWYENTEDPDYSIDYEISVDEIEDYELEDASFVMIDGTVFHDSI